MVLQCTKVFPGLDGKSQNVVFTQKCLDGIGVLGICDRASHDWRADDRVVEFVLVIANPFISLEGILRNLVQPSLLLARLGVQICHFRVGRVDEAF